MGTKVGNIKDKTSMIRAVLNSCVTNGANCNITLMQYIFKSTKYYSVKF